MTEKTGMAGAMESMAEQASWRENRLPDELAGRIIEMADKLSAVSAFTTMSERLSAIKDVMWLGETVPGLLRERASLLAEVAYLRGRLAKAREALTEEDVYDTSEFAEMLSQMLYHDLPGTAVPSADEAGEAGPIPPPSRRGAETHLLVGNEPACNPDAKIPARRLVVRSRAVTCESCKETQAYAAQLPVMKGADYERVKLLINLAWEGTDIKFKLWATSGWHKLASGGRGLLGCDGRRADGWRITLWRASEMVSHVPFRHNLDVGPWCWCVEMASGEINYGHAPSCAAARHLALTSRREMTEGLPDDQG